MTDTASRTLKLASWNVNGLADEQGGALILERRQPGEAFAEPQSQRHRHLV